MSACRPALRSAGARRGFRTAETGAMNGERPRDAASRDAASRDARLEQRAPLTGWWTLAARDGCAPGVRGRGGRGSRGAAAPAGSCPVCAGRSARWSVSAGRARRHLMMDHHSGTDDRWQWPCQRSHTWTARRPTWSRRVLRGPLSGPGRGPWPARGGCVSGCGAAQRRSAVCCWSCRGSLSSSCSPTATPTSSPKHVAFMAHSVWPIRATVAQLPYPTRVISDIPARRSDHPGVFTALVPKCARAVSPRPLPLPTAADLAAP